MKFIRLLICLFLLVSLSAYSSDNGNYAYELKHKDGHYYFDALIEQTPVKDIMLESGIPGLLIGDSIFHQCFNNFGLNDLPKESKKKIRLLNNIYTIAHIQPLTCRIDDGIFTGNIFVLEGYDGIALPVQSLVCNDSTKTCLEIDLNNNRMQFFNESDWTNKSGYHAFDLERITGMPVINTSVSIVSGNATGTIAESKYILDFGNGALLFLMKGNQDIDQMISSSEIEISTAKNKEGKVVSEGIYADSCEICGRKFENVSIGLTDKMKGFQKFSGLIGLKFFTEPVILDFSKNKIYVKQ